MKKQSRNKQELICVSCEMVNVCFDNNNSNNIINNKNKKNNNNIIEKKNIGEEFYFTKCLVLCGN